MPRGRKTDYTYEKLKKVVNLYCEMNKNKKITISGLVRYSNISKNTWYRSQEIIDYINSMNTSPISTATSHSDIVTATDLYDQCNGNETKIKATFSQLLDIIETLTVQNNILKSKIDEMAGEDVDSMKEEIASKDRIISKLNDKINEITLKDDKLINIGDNLDKMEAKTFSEQFSYLFDD